MNAINLGILIRNKRKEKGLSQKDFAAQLHVSPAAVNKWEKGKNYPDLQNLHTISALFEIPIAELLMDCPPTIPTDSIPESPDAAKPEPADVALPNVSEPILPELPAVPMPDPEPTCNSVPHKKRRKRVKIALSLSAILFVGVFLFCLAARETNSIPSFIVCDTYYGDYKGENAYYVITELEKEPTSDNLFYYGDIIRNTYEEHFSNVNKIIIIFIQNYDLYRKNGFNNNTDYLSILFPIISE